VGQGALRSSRSPGWSAAVTNREPNCTPALRSHGKGLHSTVNRGSYCSSAPYCLSSPPGCPIVSVGQISNWSSFMKSKTFTSAGRALSLLLLISTPYVLAQQGRSVHFSGLINDYSPPSATVKGSPWEMHGQWSMDVHPERGTADFSADMTMSGYGKTSAGAVDPAQP